ncbi:MAG: aminopeptidase P family protein [Planctomycetaceae bacterium]
MKPIAIDPQLFVGNRERLRGLLPPKSVVVVNANDILPTNADGSLPHVQNADLFYLTGILQEESILVLAPDAYEEKHREILFVREPNELALIWEGHKLSKAEATGISGIRTVKWLAEFPTVFRSLMCEAEQVWLNTNEHARAADEVETRELRFLRACQRQYPLHQYRRLARLVAALRVVKQPQELELLRTACQITGLGFRRLLKFVKPGVNECEVEAELAHEFLRHKGGFAYNPIIATGANNCVLHYNVNDQVCEAGQLLLLDVASAYGQYNADLTRTIPVSGRFTPRQRQVYDAVLRIFRGVVEQMRPGKTTRDLRQLTERLAERELIELGVLKAEEVARQDPEAPLLRKYFMHGVAHPLGLDVHDVGAPAAPIAPGWVLTCEPALYLREEGFGVRLENDILVTESAPIDLMVDIPIEADEIEALMAS